MSKRGYRISNEIKEQVLDCIKKEGVSVADAAKDHGISTHSIYNWLSQGARSISMVEYNKLRKENERLKQLLGEITLKLSLDEKRGS
jgi:transposase-like protein